MGEQDKTDKDKRIRVTQAVEQDKTDKYKRIRVTQAVEQDKTDKDKRIRVTQAVEQDKTDKDKRIRVTQALEQDKADKSDKRINFAASQKTRLYYEGLSPQEKEEFWGRVRRGNKADETKDSWQHHISIG